MDSFFDSTDRRSHERVQSNARVQYFIKKHSLRYMDCEMVDVSRSGMGVRIPASETVEPDMEVLLEITLPGSLEQVTLRGTILWLQRSESIRAGIRFDALLEPELLTRLMAC
jgi:hypothetical protein